MGANKGKLLFTLIAVFAIAAVGAGAMTLAGSTKASPNAPATQVDVSGNCDEAEHANDPECAALGGTAPQPTGEPTPEDRASDDPNDDVRGLEPGEDISGPCDEAEHANDPQCTGAQVDDRNDDRDVDHSGNDDSSGHGSDDSDRSGSNSGRG